jgi:hypothetical protein
MALSSSCLDARSSRQGRRHLWRSENSTSSCATNEIQLALVRHLRNKYGDVVPDELRTGAGARIDVVLRLGSDYWFYEIETALSARGCVRGGLAQLLEYCFWPSLQEAGRLIIVGEPALDLVCAAVYYERFDMTSGQLEG